MARPTQDALETFMSITGVSEAVALRKLEEHGGDLNEAVNAHFNEGDRISLHASPDPAAYDDFMDINEPVGVEPERPPFSLFTRRSDPFSPFDENFGRSIFGGRGSTELPSHGPRVSQPREVREIPIEVKEENNVSGSSGPTIEDVTESATEPGSEFHGIVVIDDEDEDLTVPSVAKDERKNNEVHAKHPGTSSPCSCQHDFDNDIEEEMIQAAIEASRREASSDPWFDYISPALEDAELSRAVSLSLEGLQIGQKGSSSLSESMEDKDEMATTNARQRFQSGSETSSRSRSDEDVADVKPVMGHHPLNFPSGTAIEAGQLMDSPPSSPIPIDGYPQNNRDEFHPDEWGGISSKEHDKALMLEGAIFGGVNERTEYPFANLSHQVLQSESGTNGGLIPPEPHSPSATLAAQQHSPREKQDGEYIAVHEADKEKELKAVQEAAPKERIVEEGKHIKKMLTGNFWKKRLLHFKNAWK